MINQSKDVLRREAKERRNALPQVNASALVPHFMQALKPQPGQVFALYLARGDELNPAPLLGALQGMGCICALPVVMPDSRVMRFARWQNGDALKPGAFGIGQPAVTNWVTPATVVLPLLAFDGLGNRLGYGGGHYDATLGALRATRQITAVGLALDGQKVPDLLPAEPHDIPLDWVITPTEAFKFT